MNIQQLRCIVEIARVGSITKAAENLYMNQPNLSRTVIEFEKEYGITQNYCLVNKIRVQK